MKKKGFTLIELLAVIIVIAVIAIITVPTILGIIDKSRKTAYKDSIYGIIDSARIYLATNQENIKSGEEIEFVCNGITCSRQNNGDKLEFKGEVPKSGSIYLYGDGSILVESVYNGKYYANNETGEVVITEDDTTLTRGELTELVKQLQEEVRDLRGQVNNKADNSNITNITNKHNSDILNINEIVDNHSSLITDLETGLTGKAALVHAHDDRYYTESEINSKISSINTNMKDYIIVKPVVVQNVSVAANSEITISFPIPTIKGYKCILGVAASSNNGYLIPQRPSEVPGGSYVNLYYKNFANFGMSDLTLICNMIFIRDI